MTDTPTNKHHHVTRKDDPTTKKPEPHDRFDDLHGYIKARRDPRNIAPFETVIKRTKDSSDNPTLAKMMGKTIK